jgi:hypothetical protein
MSAGAVGLDTAAQRLAEGVVQSLPVTLASVAVWDRPSYALTVRGVSAMRRLPGTPVLGARMALSSAPWHRAVLERHEPVLVERGPDGPAGAAGAGPELEAPGLRSVYLLPIRVGRETVGVLTLGEMRSPAREPFSDEKRRRCRAVLDELVAASAPAWEVDRLRRQVRALTFLVQVVRHLLDVRTPQDLLGCLAHRVADWVGAPVKGLLLRPGAGRDLAIAARWHLPEVDDEAARQLVMAVARAAGRQTGPVGLARVAEDPLDPLHEGAAGEPWTRLCVPLLRDARLAGVACLYVADELQPAPWELEMFRWMGEVAAAWLDTLDLGEAERRDARWLREATGDLLDAHYRSAMHAAVAEAAARVRADLPARLARLAADLLPGAEPTATTRLAEAAIGAVAASLAAAAASPGPGAPGAPGPAGLNALVARAVALARGARAAAGGTARIEVEPGPGDPLVAGSTALVSVLAHVLGDLAREAPPGARVRVETRRDASGAGLRLLVALPDPGVPAAPGDEPAGPEGSPALRRAVALLGALADRVGGSVRLGTGEPGGPVLDLRLPAVDGSAGPGPGG